jgi:hypothetical protein
MAERILDVHIELDPVKLAKEQDMVKTVAMLSREAAEAEAEREHVILRHPDPSEVVLKQGVSVTTGKDVMMVATRWVGDG